MLILGRRKDERVIIQTSDGTIAVCVVEVRSDRCRIGFEAPESIVIHREEVWEAIQKRGLKKFKPGPKVHRTEIED